MAKYIVREWHKGLVVKEEIIEAENLEEAEEIAIPKITIEEEQSEDL